MALSPALVLLVDVSARYCATWTKFHRAKATRDPADQRSFYEASHLDSDVDMVRVIQALINEERRRKAEAEGETVEEIFIRPDHGHQMMDDIGKTVNPGYSGIGRMKGLAEVRGVIRALSLEGE